MNDIYNMELHEVIMTEDEKLGTHIYILRVPGGWIYHWGETPSSNDVFVPFHNEFL